MDRIEFSNLVMGRIVYNANCFKMTPFTPDQPYAGLLILLMTFLTSKWCIFLINGAFLISRSLFTMQHIAKRYNILPFKWPILSPKYKKHSYKIFL